MGIVTRAKLLLRIKTNAVIDELENPLETLDYAEQQQRELLREVGQGLIEVATARQRLVRQGRNLGEQLEFLTNQAGRALDADREDLARVALTKKQAILAERTGLDAQIEQMKAEEQSLVTAHQELTSRVEAFRSQRITLSARHESATARVQVSEALTGVSSGLAELGMAVGRAQETTERLQARATALDAVMSMSDFSSVFGTSDAVERELRDVDVKRAVEEELRAMRRRRAQADADQGEATRS